MLAINTLFEENFVKEAIAYFVRKVYLLLENTSYEDIMCWHTDNQTIIVKDCDKLVQEVLPVVFKQKTLKSFIRQLNMYNFRKLKNGYNPKFMYFQNELFMRGNIESLIFIKRKQRGYIEKTKLESQAVKSLLEKYHIFSNGIFEKLKEQFRTLMELYPKVGSELLGLIKEHSSADTICPISGEDEVGNIITSDPRLSEFIMTMKSINRPSVLELGEELGMSNYADMGYSSFDE